MRRRQAMSGPFSLLFADPVEDLVGRRRTMTLRLLAGFEPLTAIDASKRLGLSARRMRRALDDLVTLHLATRRGTTYWLNESYVLTQPLLEALDARRAVITRLSALTAEICPDAVVAIHAEDHPEKLGVLILTADTGNDHAAELKHLIELIVPTMIGSRPVVRVVTETELRRLIELEDPIAVRSWWWSMTIHGPDLATTMLEIARKHVHAQRP